MWKTVCCEVQGRSHLKTNTPCQDKTKQLFLNNVSVIALADGAGSARLSHFGAACVVERSTQFVSAHFQQLMDNPDGKHVKITLIEELTRAIAMKAAELHCTSADLASTLLLAAVCEDKYIIIHIGDGVVGYLEGEDLKVASAPDNGEFANVTTFVTSREALTALRLFKGSIKNISGFVLMSDGTEQSLYHKSTKSLGKAVTKLMHRVCLVEGHVLRAQLIETLNSVIAKNTQDDCSIAILARPYGMLRPLEYLTDQERRELFQIPSNHKNLQKRISRYDAMITLLKKPLLVKQVARAIHLKPKYTQRYLNHLVSLGLIVKGGSVYSRRLE